MVDFSNPEYFTHVINQGGKLVEIPLRRGCDDAAFIDYLTFTFCKLSLNERINQKVVYWGNAPDDVYINVFSEVLAEIFGFGITEKRQGKGKFFYEGYYQLGSIEVNYGTVHIGGQRNTILVDLSGVGCQAALVGWEKRLYDFANQVERFSISRVDVATDFFNGEYSPLMALNDYKKGRFDVRGMRPKYKPEGTDWFNDDATGKTLYIGRRGSSKFCRVYEKGKQLGDVQSLWTRFEIEFRKNDCLIPNEILIQSGQFLAGAYPVGERLFQAAAIRIHATEKKLETTLDDKLHHGRNQVGRLVRYLFDSGWTAEEIVKKLIAAKGQYPKGLKPLEYDCTSEQVDYIHDTQSIDTHDEDLAALRQKLCIKAENNEISTFILDDLDEDIEHFNYLKLTDANESVLNEMLNSIFGKYTPFLNNFPYY